MARLKVKNIPEGFYNATGFHPIRKNADYDPDRAGDEYSQSSRPKKRKVATKKRKATKKATAKRKATKRATKKNPFPGVPKGKFLHARFNRDGTVSVVVPKKRTAVRKRSRNPNAPAGYSQTWYRKGFTAGERALAGLRPQWSRGDQTTAWKAATGKPKSSGARVTAQESFYLGYHEGRYGK